MRRMRCPARSPRRGRDRRPASAKGRSTRPFENGPAQSGIRLSTAHVLLAPPPAIPFR